MSRKIVDPSAEAALLLTDEVCGQVGILPKALSFVHIAAVIVSRPGHVKAAMMNVAGRDGYKEIKSCLIEEAGLEDATSQIEKGITTSTAFRLPIGGAIRSVCKTAMDKLPDRNHRVDDARLLDACIINSPMVEKIFNDAGLKINFVRESKRKSRARHSKGMDYKELQTLYAHSRCMNEQAHSGEFDKIVGREREISLLIETLGRKTKRNPVLVGDPGVGKTAIVEKLAQMLVDGDQRIPEYLEGTQIFCVSLGSMVAGTQYRGQFEEKVQQLIREATSSKDIILFIDEIHTLVGAGGAHGSMDAAALLLPSLARGNLSIIGSTTSENYQKFIEKDRGLERRMQPIPVSEPTEEQMGDILHAIQGTYEAFHGILIEDTALKEAKDLAKRYYRDKRDPDRTIDLVDAACAYIKSQTPEKSEKIIRCEKAIQDLIDQTKEVVAAHDFKSLPTLRRKLRNKQRYLRRLRVEEEKNQADKLMTVGIQTVANVVSRSKNLSVAAIQTDEAARLLALEDDLKELVVGQDPALAVLSDAIRRNRVGIRDVRKPIGVFLFLGPTGVGKTHSAKMLAKLLFDDEKTMIRIDMAEYQEQHSVSKFTGPPPGYIGYDDTNDVVSKIRRVPHGILLLDEIEKAHPSIYDILLGIFDDGSLSDTRNNIADFRNFVVIMTSNVGGRRIAGQSSISLIDTNDETDKFRDLASDLKKIVQNKFSPEFLNRVDDMVVFRSLSKANQKDITHLVLREISETGKFILKLTDAAATQLAENGYSKKFGARALRREIQKSIESPMAKEILSGKFKEGQTILIDWKEKFIFTQEMVHEPVH